jgi:hypothetical protein
MNEGSPKKKPEDGRRKTEDRGQKIEDSSMLGPLPSALRNPSFSGWPMIIGWLAMLIFAFHACTHMVAAGDTWVAMACGRHFVNHGVNTVEPFSANSHKAGPTPEEVQTWPKWAQAITNTIGLNTVAKWHPTGWIDQNWLTHVIFYKLTTMFGSEDKPYFDALVYWKFIIYILVVACLYFTSRVLGVNRALAVVFACAAMFIGRSFLDVRPAGFSNLMVPTFLLVLALTSYRNALYIWLIVPLIVFWSNVHGGYIYAFLMLVPFVGWHVMMRLPKRWAIAIYSIGTWAVMCLLAHGLPKLLIDHFRESGLSSIKVTPLQGDWVFYVFFVATAGAVALAWNRKISEKALVGVSLATSVILFMVYLAGRFLPQVPPELSSYGQQLFWTDVRGAMLAYIGVFSFAMILGLTVAWVRDRVVQVMEPRAIVHTIAAGVAAFIAMVVLNPFHLTNLTHTFIISVSESAERWRDVHEWHRAFDWTNPVGTAIPFLVMYILGWVCVALWAFALLGASRIADRLTVGKKGVARKNASAEQNWPKMDIVLVAIAAMTVYMAIRSRRFIPIAAYAACPILALLVDRIAQVTAAAVGMVESGKWQVPSLPRSVQRAVVAAGAVAVLAFGVCWGVQFKHIYLDYWPADPVLTSVFMRMTASDAKPFTACQFIRDNKLSGNMFNYWTEGGFVAWGQTPDPNTGRTPLQLFMDGRAQAAYDRTIFDRWTGIMQGGPIVEQAARAGRSPNQNEYPQIAQWISSELRKDHVWVVLMPSGQFDTAFVTALEISRDWRTILTNNKEKLFVDVAAQEGRKLYDDMMAGKLVYPDEFSADLAIGHNLLLLAGPEMKEQRKQGLDLVIKAFELDRSPAPVIDLLTVAGRFPELQEQVNQACLAYTTDFEKNNSNYAGHDGYNLRIEAARLCLIQLKAAAQAQGNPTAAQTYSERIARYANERDHIANTKRW